MPSYLTSIVLEWSRDALDGSTFITNRTFDDAPIAGVFTGWTENDAGAASLTPSHETTLQRTGAGCLKLVNTAGGEDDYMQTTFTGVAGTTYTIRAWVNVTVFTAGAAFNLGLRAFDPGAGALDDDNITAATGGWTLKELTLTPVTSGTVAVRLYAPQGTTYWDDVSVVGWRAVSNNEIQSIEWWAGIDREGNDPEPGGMQVTLKNKNRKWEPLFGSNLIDTQQRFRLTVNGQMEGLWYTESFDLDYPDGQEFSWVTITCGDGMTILALDDMEMLDPPEAETYEDVVSFDEPWGYWRLGEPEGTKASARFVKVFRGKGKKRRKIKIRRGTRYSTREEADGSVGEAGTYRNTPSLGQPGLILGDQDTAVEFRSSGSEYVRIPVEQDTFLAQYRLSIECWVKITVDQTMHLIAGPMHTGTAAPMFGLQRNSPAENVTFYVNTGAGSANAVTSTATLGVGETHHIVGTFDSTNIRIFIDGVLDTTGGTPGTPVTADVGEFLYIGQAGSGASYADAIIDEVAVYEHKLSAARILAHYQAGAERGMPEEDAYARIAGMAGSDLWSVTGDISNYDVQPHMHYGQSKLEEIFEVVHAMGPLSLLFFDNTAELVFLGNEWQDYWERYRTVSWTFTDDGTGKPYQDVQLEYDFETFNEVQANKEGGELVTVTDATESGKRGRRVNTEYTDLVLADQHDVETVASGVLDYYKEPAKRPVSLTIDGHHCLAQILDLDIGMVIHVKKQGETGAATERVTHIIGKRKQIDTSKHLTCTYTLSRGFDPTGDLWRLSYDGYSELGETTVLG